jgi:hypothetical protein
MWVALNRDNNPQLVFDKHFALTCPHCGVHSNITAVSIPRYEHVERFKLETVAVCYRCDSCNAPITLIFKIKPEFGNLRVLFDDTFSQVEHAKETFEYDYLPTEVSADLREALACYSLGCYNAFAAMSRRCVQSVATDLGAKGSDRVLGQLKDLKEMAEIDEDTYILLKQIIIDGHDGAHPHLPSIDFPRAAVLLELIKDVLYQLYVRKGKLQEAIKLRSQANGQKA